MLGLRLPSQPGGIPANLGSFEPLPFLDTSRLACAAESVDNQTLHLLLHQQMSMPALKRKRSVRDIESSVANTAEAAQAAPDDQLHAGYSEQKRTKLGYHRTSIACGHCRRRKIRCLIPIDAESSRCSNCIRLKKDCSFHPVDQSIPSGKRKPKTSKSLSTASIALSPTSTVPPPKRGFSDSSVKYSKVPPTSREGFLGLGSAKVHSPEILGSSQEQFSNLYATRIDQNWLTPGYHPLTPMSDQPQQPQDAYAANVVNTMWDSTVLPHPHTHHRSPSWQELNQQSAIPSPQPHFTSSTRDFSFSRPIPRSTSHPELRLEKDYFAHTSPFLEHLTEPSHLDYQQMITSEPLIQATTSEAVTMSLQAPLLADVPVLSYPTAIINEPATPFAYQHQWAMFQGQQDNHERSETFEERQYPTPWF